MSFKYVGYFAPTCTRTFIYIYNVCSIRNAFRKCRPWCKDQQQNDKSEIHCYAIAHGSFFHRTSYCSVEKSFARKRNQIYSARVQMWHMNRQGERKIFPRFFANANESATWQATFNVRFPAYGNAH